MPPKKKQRFSSLQQQEQVIQDFLGNISDDKETPFDNDISFEDSDDEEEIPAVAESESEDDEGDEEYEQLPRKQLFKTLDECCDETNYQHLEVQDEENNRTPIRVQTRNSPGSGIQRKKEELVAELQTKTYWGVQKDQEEDPRLRKCQLKVLNFS